MQTTDSKSDAARPRHSVGRFVRRVSVEKVEPHDPFFWPLPLVGVRNAIGLIEVKAGWLVWAWHIDIDTRPRCKNCGKLLHNVGFDPATTRWTCYQCPPNKPTDQ